MRARATQSVAGGQYCALSELHPPRQIGMLQEFGTGKNPGPKAFQPWAVIWNRFAVFQQPTSGQRFAPVHQLNPPSLHYSPHRLNYLLFAKRAAVS